MSNRKKIPKAIESRLLLASGRRCCLCFFLENQINVRKGQIAHLNQDPSDFRFENLVWLCLDHHDDYDSRTSQAKGLTQDEVRLYRSRLYQQRQEKIGPPLNDAEIANLPELRRQQIQSEINQVKENSPSEFAFIESPWRYPLWQVANKPDLFAYKSRNQADGICLIERINLPDGRVVIACISVAGNPGISITNAVEDICMQVCDRFEISPDTLVWLEHYSHYDDGRWSIVTFDSVPPAGPFFNPTWTTMNPDLWQSLNLSPNRKLTHRDGVYNSPIEKHFSWPTENLT